MLGVSEGLLGSSGDGTAATATAHESDGGGGGSGAGEVGGGGVGSNSGMFGEEEKGRIIEEGDRNSAGNRWPRQETMALLKIRSDMDAAFRDSSPKGPLWEEVSRKLAELGYHRSAKKCKEKFENVYKYHKRTKDDRATKSDGKTYRFFDQLQALEHHNQLSLLPPPSRPQTLQPPHPAMPETNPPTLSQVTVPSTTSPTIVTTIATTTTLSHNTFPPPPTTTSPTPITTIFPPSFPNVSAAAANPVSNSMSSSSTSTSSDEELFREGRRKRKRKWEDYFERLMKEMIEKQEALQTRFLDRIEIRERDRMAREEAWRMQEMARMNREREILAQERSTAAAKDAAMIAFLQKISGQQNTPVQLSNNNNNPSPAPAPPPPPPLPHPQPQPHQQVPTPTTTTLPLPLPPPPPRLKTQPVNIPTLDNGENLKLNSNLNLLSTTNSSRWPKAEVEALIQLRTNLDIKYQDNGPKGPLWEEISDGLRKLGYNRNAKRCKEKWENINKYFKKVKESNKQRPEDSKTCPYYHLLDALYKEKNKNNDNNSTVSSSFNPTCGNLKSENNPMVPLMVQPERQWPLQPPDENNVNQNQEEEGGDEDDDEEDEGGGNYEIVANKPSSMETVE